MNTEKDCTSHITKRVAAITLLIASLAFAAAIQPISVACAQDLVNSDNTQVTAANASDTSNAMGDENSLGTTETTGDSDNEGAPDATDAKNNATIPTGATNTGDCDKPPTSAETDSANTPSDAGGATSSGTTSGNTPEASSDKTPAETNNNKANANAETTTPANSQTASASESQTPPLEDGAIYVISSAVNQDYVLDVSGGSHEAGANVQIYKSNGTLAQAFKAVWISDNWYYLINMASGNALDVCEGSSKNCANVQQYTQNQTKAQMWKIVKNADGSFTIYAGTNPEQLALDLDSANASSGTNVRLFVINGTAAQQWFFIKQSVLTDAANNSVNIADGIYTIVSGLPSGRVVDVTGASTDCGANVQIYDSNHTFAQKVRVISLGAAGSDGANIYVIQFTNSDKVMDVAYALTEAGSNVWQYDRNGTRAQYWFFKKAAQSGFYNIYSLLSGLVLDVVSASDANGANVQVFTLNNTLAQAFRLDATQMINNGTYVIQSTVMLPMVIDVSGASCDSGANIQTWRSNGSGAQKFAITHLGGEIYQILNINSWQSLDVCCGSWDSGANVQQYAWNNTDAQKWRIFYSDGTFTIQNVGSGMFLDLTGASRFAGANVQQYGWNGSAAQRWILRDENWTFYAGASWDAMRFIEKAEEYQGWSYVWGGRSPNVGFDCAGLVMYCANETLGKSYNLMYTNAQSLFYNHCYEIAEWEAQPGDLVFYRGTYGSDVNYISHVVIYCGNGIYYGAGDPIGYDWVYGIRNIYGETASVIYARMW